MKHEIKERRPLVSIIIPVFNGSAYMREAIDSALAQTYQNIEIIVVNDGSNDNGKTEEIALSYGDKIRYLCKDNGGVSSALNLGIQNMRGEYFSWLSHDDKYSPQKIEAQVAALTENNKCVCLCATKTIDKDSKTLSTSNIQSSRAVLEPNEALLYVLQYGANGCAFLIPRLAFEEVGLFNEDLRYCQDVLMWWNIFLAGYSLVFSDYVGVSYRVHANQVTQTRRDLYKHDVEIVGEAVIAPFAKASSKEHNVLYAYAVNEAKQGNTAVLNRCLSTAAQNKLFSPAQHATLWFIEKYGLVRPYIRKVYYRLFRGITVG